MIEFNDIRDWIDKTKKIGELKVIEGADPHLEVGTMVQINGPNLGPALLFYKLKGYEEGFRIVTNSAGNIKTFNLTFGLPVENSIRETVEALRVKADEWAQRSDDFPYKVTDSGPILENIEEGDNVDLEKFPGPLWHELDGGRYIGTGVGIITREPDSGILNTGTYRNQLHHRQNVGFYITRGKHGRLPRNKYFVRGIIFAVKPYAWYNDFPQTSLNSEALRRQVFSKWDSEFEGRWKKF